VTLAAVLHAPGDVRLEERPDPRPGPHEVAVDVGAVGVCGSDVHYYEHGRIGSFVVEQPLVLGHESAGVVAEIGTGVRGHAVGDRVTIEPGVPDLSCDECRRGRYNLCPNMRFYGTPPIDGAFARRVLIHEAFAYSLPDALSLQQGALMEPLSVGVWACRKGAVGPGSRVLVTGAGPIGNLAAQCARAFGASEVVVTDVDAGRLEVAARTGGATRTVQVGEHELDVEADVLLECSGNEAALIAGIGALAPAGTAVCVGMGPHEDATIPLALIQRRELWLTGTFRYANTYPTAIALALDGLVDLEAIITGTYGLRDTEAALRAGRDDPAAIKPIVLPQEDRLS
jgi:L-iditol 2-dehydrogenase